MLNSKEFVRELQLRHESAWMNPNLESADAALAALPLTRTDVDDAEARLERFAPFIKKVFPETAADRGLIESPLTVWRDRIFEKCGIGRDEGGDGGKTLEIRGKRRLPARDRGANYQQS